jgi:hypothetical protein
MREETAKIFPEGIEGTPLSDEDKNYHSYNAKSIHSFQL